LRQLSSLAKLAGAEVAPTETPAEEKPAAAAGSGRSSEGGVPAGSPVPPSLDPVFQHRYAPAAEGGKRPLAGEIIAQVESRVSRQRPRVSGVRQSVARFGNGAMPAPALAKETRMEDWSASPPGGASYGPLSGWATKSNAVTALERLAKDAVAAEGLTLESVPALGIVRNPDETAEGFEDRLRKAVAAEIEKRASKVEGPLARRIQTLERQIATETRELERDRAEKGRATAYSAIDVGASVLGTILGGGKRSVGTGVRAGGRAYGRIRRAEESIKESETTIAAWTQERDALLAERESELAAARREIESAAASREETRIPINRTDIRVVGWYVLWS